MSDRISANEFRESLDRHLSDMKADPWLAQRIIASENGEIKMKKKRCFGLILAVVLLLALTTVAFAVTRLYRVINWQGDVTRTIDPTQTPASASEDAADMNRLQEWMLEELDYPSLICEDGIHPNEAGHEIIARKAIEHFPHKG